MTDLLLTFIIYLLYMYILYRKVMNYGKKS